MTCEPQLGRRGLYPTLPTRGSTDAVRRTMDLLAYCDGEHDLLAAVDRLGCPVWELYGHVDLLAGHGLVTAQD